MPFFSNVIFHFTNNVLRFRLITISHTTSTSYSTHSENHNLFPVLNRSLTASSRIPLAFLLVSLSSNSYKTHPHIHTSIPSSPLLCHNPTTRKSSRPHHALKSQFRSNSVCNACYPIAQTASPPSPDKAPQYIVGRLAFCSENTTGPYKSHNIVSISQKPKFHPRLLTK